LSGNLLSFKGKCEGWKMSVHRLRSIDETTGEVLEGVAVWVAPRAPTPYRGWYMQSQDAILALAQDKELAGRPTRVLLYLLSRLDYENFLYVPQVDVCEALGLKAPHVSSAIKLLTEKGILIRGPRIGRSFGWRLNPHFGWRGKVRNLHEARIAKRHPLPA